MKKLYNKCEGYINYGQRTLNTVSIKILKLLIIKFCIKIKGPSFIETRRCVIKEVSKNKNRKRV